MRKFLTSALAAFFILTFAAAPANADDPDRLTVIELFTSQGCSSCPPADAILKTMRDRPGLLTLSWAVDYWDRLGWEDTFADPYNSMRQTAYNKRFGRGGVFTPQMIIDGRVQSIGSMADEVRASVEKARAMDRDHLTPQLSQEGDKITVSLGNHAAMKMVAVRYVWYTADATVKIGDGENQGRTLHYTNIVRDSEVIEDWNGHAKTYVLDAAVGRALGADHVAILLQNMYGHGPIVGAASMAIGPAEKATN
jgi:hypothetical protein